MRHVTGILTLAALTLLACTDTAPTASPVESLAVSSNADSICSNCAFGPRRFVVQEERSEVTFTPATGLAGDCTLAVKDDGRRSTNASIWFNERVVVERPALLGPTTIVRRPVTVLAGSNTIAVSVRGDPGHFVTVRIACAEQTARILISAGNGQAAQPGSPVQIPPAVVVSRADGSPWPGVVVTFAVASGGGTVTEASQTTGTDGVATVGGWTLGDALGPNALTATAALAGLTGNPVTFTALGLEIHTLAAWSGHSCGIASDGATYCWGQNNSGQLGDGTATDRYQPTRVTRAPKLVSLTAGWYFTCGLTADGAAYCWGRDPYLPFPWTPSPAGGALRFAELSAGTNSICGLATDGTAYCWGFNSSGQLGDGTTLTRSTPTAVTGGLTFGTLVAGESHACGLTQAGEAYCWGLNQWGELGDSTTTDRLVPTRVATTERFAKLTVGKLHTCGLTSAGEAWCWGLNSGGAVGDGTGINRSAPTRVYGGLTFTALTAGAVHTCGLATGGAAYCWGQATKGELGIGPAPNWVFQPAPVVGGLQFRSIVAGWEHVCAVTTAGAAYCWGANESGGLGDGTTVNRFTPTSVLGGLQF